MSLLKNSFVLAAVTTAAFSVSSSARAAAVLYAGGTYSQTFDNLLTTVPANNTTVTTAAVVPVGWSVVEAGANANTTSRVDAGSSTTGDTFLWGATASNERALGSYASGSLTAQYGVEISNTSNVTITSFTLDYTGEQWKDGGSTAAVLNTLGFAYGIGNTNLTTGTYTNQTALDFTALVNNTTADAAKDGNDASFQSAKSATISGVTWAPGTSLWLRWSDINEAGNDDGLGIDNVSFTAVVPEPATLTSAVGIAGMTLLRRRKRKV